MNIPNEIIFVLSYCELKEISNFRQINKLTSFIVKNNIQHIMYNLFINNNFHRVSNPKWFVRECYYSFGNLKNNKENFNKICMNGSNMSINIFLDNGNKYKPELYEKFLKSACNIGNIDKILKLYYEDKNSFLNLLDVLFGIIITHKYYGMIQIIINNIKSNDTRYLNYIKFIKNKHNQEYYDDKIYNIFNIN